MKSESLKKTILSRWRVFRHRSFVKKLTTHDQSALANFESVYEMQESFIDRGKVKNIGNKTNPRFCRYCRKSTPAVTFRSVAHLIPELMGNKHLRFLEECDDCNTKIFSPYESELGSYTLLTRILTFVQGKKGRGNTVKEPGTQFRVEKKGNTVEINDDYGAGRLLIDIKKKQFTVNATSSYIPMHIYKALAKMGFALLSESELSGFDRLRRWLTSNAHDATVSKGMQCMLRHSLVPGILRFPPSIALFKKRKERLNEPFFEKMLIVRFGNQILQIALPGSDADIKIAKKSNSLQFAHYPVLLTKKYQNKYGNPKIEEKDLSGIVRIREQQSRTMQAQNIKRII